MSWWENVQTAITEVLFDLGRVGVDYLERIFVSIVVLLIGFTLAKLLAMLLQWLLKQIRFDSLMERIGVGDSMARIGFERKPSALVPSVLYWIVMLAFTQTIARHIGLTIVAEGLTALLSYLPNAIAGFLILLLGIAFGRFLSRAVTNSARGTGIGFARALGGLVHSLTIVVAGVMAMGQLGVDTRILLILTVVIFSGFSIAFAITFGLGTRDATKNLIGGYYARREFSVGEEVQIGEERGFLRSVSATQTFLETKRGTAAIPNAVFLDQVVLRVAPPR